MSLCNWNWFVSFLLNANAILLLLFFILFLLSLSHIGCGLLFMPYESHEMLKCKRSALRQQIGKRHSCFGFFCFDHIKCMVVVWRCLVYFGGSFTSHFDKQEDSFFCFTTAIECFMDRWFICDDIRITYNRYYYRMYKITTSDFTTTCEIRSGCQWSFSTIVENFIRTNYDLSIFNGQFDVVL